MSQDPRCCGSGTCIINEEGLCWCGQRWVGDQLVTSSNPGNPQPSHSTESLDTHQSTDQDL